MGIRALLLIFGILPVGTIATLLRPFWGLVILSLIYFVRPRIYGAPVFLSRLVFIFTIITLLGMLIGVIQSTVKIKLTKGVVLSGLIYVVTWALGFYAVASTSESFLVSSRILKLLVAQFLVANLIDDKKKLNIFFWSMALGSCWLYKSTIYAFVRTGSLRVDGVGGQGGGANYLALVVTTLLPFIIFKLTSENKIEKYLSMGILPAMLLALVISGSRAGFLAALVVLFFTFKKSRYKARMFAVVSIVLLVLLPYISGEYIERMQSITVSEGEVRDTSSQSRLDLWRAALIMFSEHPFTGIGQDNFRLISPEYVEWRATRAHNGSTGLVCHNTFFQMLAEGGIVSMFIFIIMVYHSLFSLNRYENSELKGFIGIIKVGLMAFYTNAFFSSYFTIDILWWYWGLVDSAVLISKKIKQQHAEDAETSSYEEKDNTSVLLARI